MTASEADAELLPVDYFAEPEPPEESDSHERSHLSFRLKRYQAQPQVREVRENPD